VVRLFVILEESRSLSYFIGTTKDIRERLGSEEFERGRSANSFWMAIKRSGNFDF
jgi:hypothetical protein